MWSEGQNRCREQVRYVWESGGRSHEKMVDTRGRGPGKVLQVDGKEEADNSEL